MSGLVPTVVIASRVSEFRGAVAEQFAEAGFRVQAVSPRAGRLARVLEHRSPDVLVVDTSHIGLDQVTALVSRLPSPPVLVALADGAGARARIGELVSTTTGSTARRRRPLPDRRFHSPRAGSRPAVWEDGAVPTSVVIADDHRLVLDALRRALADQPDFEIVAETDSGAHVLPLVARHAPDLVLMDVNMPGMDGLAALDLIRERHPNVKVVLISANNEASDIQAALSRGAAGYLVKSIDPADVPAALRQAISGTAFFAIDSGESTDEHLSRTVGLTDRELEILRAVARGLSNKQVASELFVTEQTVKFHLSNVYRKIGVTNRAGAVQFAMRNGLSAAV